MPISLSSLVGHFWSIFGYFLAATSHNPTKFTQKNLAKNLIYKMFDCPVVFCYFAQLFKFGRYVKFCATKKCQNLASLPKYHCLKCIKTNVCDRLKTPINGFRALLERYKKVKNWNLSKKLRV